MKPSAAYSPREVVHELRSAARQQYGRDAMTDEDLYFELNDQRGCETGSWWWRCDESVIEPETVDA